MSKLSIRRATVLLSLVFVAACTASAGNGSGAKSGDGDGEVEASAKTKITVASVQMIQDCPDTEAEPEAAPAEPTAAAMPARRAKRPSPGSPDPSLGDVEPGYEFQQPCDQSTVQLAIETTSESPVAIEIKAVRLLSEGKLVGTLETRKPKIWINNSYEAWDQQIAPGAPSKVSYKLSMPSWYEVEKKIGKSSYGHMFTLEIEVLVDGEIQTVSSPQFPREEPHVIVT